MKKSTQLCSMLLAVVAIVLFLLLGYLLMRHDIFLPKSTILYLLLIILLCSYIALRLIHKTCYIWHILFFLYATGLCYLLLVLCQDFGQLKYKNFQFLGECKINRVS